MPYNQNKDTKIHYEEIGQGPPLVLQHALTSNLNAWKQYGYTDALREEYWLILIDARGHGKSDKPLVTEAYTPEAMTGDVIAVLDDLGITKASYWGHSLGSMIGFQLLRMHPSRFNSFILGGMSPYHPQTKEEAEYWGWLRKRAAVGVEEGVEALISLVDKSGYYKQTKKDGEEEPWKKRYREQDWRVINAVVEGITGWPSVEGLLSGYLAPCFLYAGELDPFSVGAERCAGEMRSASFMSVPGRDHSGAFDDSNYLLPHVRRFLSKAS